MEDDDGEKLGEEEHQKGKKEATELSSVKQTLKSFGPGVITGASDLLRSLFLRMLSLPQLLEVTGARY
jgi:hypothetical protein